MLKSIEYSQRRIMRALEAGWSRFEAVLDRVTSTTTDETKPRLNFNPMYHMSTLSITLLMILLITGIYLTVVYRPGPDRAYASMQAIDATLIGSLMRSVHRYASDALIVVLIIHALKMFLSDRFWGGRWLAWVSGVLLVVLMLIIGVMGYFLVWDQQAQWLGEYFINFMSGDTKFTFASPQAISGAFQFFVIILFLHVFLSLLIALGIWIHEMRLQRAKLWTPLWLTITSTVALIVLSLIWPATSGEPADLTKLVTTVQLDWFYMGFLPLSQRLGSVGVWVVSGAIIVVISAIPWLLPGKHQGPAIVFDETCTGCAICARECPYDALEMIPRVIDDRYESTVRVNNDLCTGCGLCVGDCATIGIDLPGLPTERVVNDLRQALAEVATQDVAPVVVFTCQRHAVLGSLPATAGEPAGADETGWPGPVTIGTYANGGSEDVPLITCTMPCSGMTQGRWVRGSLKDGARGVVLLSCPTEDCGFREGPTWLISRISRGRYLRLLGKEVSWLQAAPGDGAALREAITTVGTESPERKKRGLPAPVSFAIGFVLLLVTLGVSLLGIQPATATETTQGVVRIVMNHASPIMAAMTNIRAESTENLPEGVTAEQVLGGARFPVQLELVIDGDLAEEWTYRPSGLRGEGATYALENLWLDPGTYDVVVRMLDDGEDWREVFNGEVVVSEAEVAVLTFDRELNAFDLMQ